MVRAAKEAMSGLESVPHIAAIYLDTPISASVRVRLPQLARDTQPTDARSACRASGLLEQPFQ